MSAKGNKGIGVSPLVVASIQMAIVFGAVATGAVLFTASTSAMWMLMAVGGVGAVAVSLMSFVTLGKIRRWLGGDAGKLEEVLRKAEQGDKAYFEADAGGDEDGLAGTVFRAVQQVYSDTSPSGANGTCESYFKNSMNQASACVMIADSDLNIVYVNPQLVQMFSSIQGELQKHIPGFSAASLVGQNIDRFHKNPQKQRAMLANLNAPHHAKFSVGEVDIEFVASPLLDDQGNRAGFFVEWKDMTAQNKIEKELQDIISAVLEGDLSQRVSLTNKKGFFLTLAQDINDVLALNGHVISEVKGVVQAIAEGNLSRKVTYDYGGEFDSLKTALNNAIDRLSEVLGGVAVAAEAVHSGTREITNGNIDLQRRTSEQAEDLEKTAAAVEQITGTVRHNAENTRQANELSAAARAKAESGGEVVSSAVEAMTEINQSSAKISAIISVIDEIAFQTNLLALNAAVEAAHAGDQGKGFAVVASEVRNLAQRSAEAAKEIKDLIEDSVAKVNSGTALVNNAGKALEEIVEATRKVSHMISEIDSANQEQSIGIEQVNQAMLRMDQMTQQNARLVEKVADSSATLDQQSETLAREMGFFNGIAAAGVSLEGSSGPRVERRSSNRPWSTVSHNNGSGDLDFPAAKSKHLSWKNRVRSFLQGRESLTHDQAVSHRDCDLGKWLYSKGMEQFGSMEEMQELEKVHANLHNEIKEIITLKESGNDNEANERFSNIERYSGRVVNLLSTLEDKARDESTLGGGQAPRAAAGGGEDWDSF